jgi:hypothetical protein
LAAGSVNANGAEERYTPGVEVLDCSEEISGGKVLASVGAPNVLFILLYAVSFVLVAWAVVDIARRPTALMSSGRKAVWIVASIVGWIVFGLFGAAIALIYLLGPRRQLNAVRW